MKYLIFLGIVALGQYSSAQIPAPQKPVLEDCPQLTVNDNYGGTYLQNDYACLNRNAVKQRDYGAALDAYNRAGQIITTDSGGMSKPQEPTYEKCESIDASGNSVTDYACQSRNSAKQREYSIQISGYNEAQSQQAAAQAERVAEQQKQQQLDAEAAAREAQAKSKQGKEKASDVSSQKSMLSAAFAAAFAASCSGGATCQYGLLAASIANAIFSGQAKKASGEYAQTEQQACTTANRLSANGGVSCDTATPGGVSDLFDPNGKCVGNQASCDSITQALPKGTSIKDTLKNVNAIASGKGPFKINPDGSVTTKAGKTFTIDNFDSEADMIASGMSPADAKAMMAKIKKSAAEEAEIEAKLALARQNSSAGSYTDNSSSGAAKSGGEILLNGNASHEKDLAGKRQIASAEGLARDFNGEQIGVAGDDIFKMMNRRYKLKASQDNFIAP